jgi:hypothetical protein
MLRWLAIVCAAFFLASCATPDQVARRRCAGFEPGTAAAQACYDTEMDRIEGANAALVGAGIGLMRASQPSYPTYIVPGW